MSVGSDMRCPECNQYRPDRCVCRPAYKSEIYYNVVIAPGSFHGWQCIYAVDGTLVFQHRDGSEWRSSPLIGGPGWLEAAWDDFTEMAVQRVMKEKNG
jgi:hypothetical protein